MGVAVSVNWEKEDDVLQGLLFSSSCARVCVSGWAGDWVRGRAGGRVGVVRGWWVRVIMSGRVIG